MQTKQASCGKKKKKNLESKKSQTNGFVKKEW